MTTTNDNNTQGASSVQRMGSRTGAALVPEVERGAGAELEVVPKEVTRIVDAMHKGHFIGTARRAGKTWAMRIATAKPVNLEYADPYVIGVRRNGMGLLLPPVGEGEKGNDSEPRHSATAESSDSPEETL